jgi:hypothetical protein
MTPTLDSNEEFPEMPEAAHDLENNEDPVYPTAWHLIDSLSNIECRQLSFDTYQLKSLTNIITINKEGFDLYRDHTSQGQVIFTDWMRRNNITVEKLAAPSKASNE